MEFQDQYKMCRELGAGATSKVYRGVNQRTGEEVAVKVISKEHVKDCQMLRNEIEIHRATDHPNILRLLEVYEDKGSLYLVTEMCKGDLWKHLSAKQDEYSSLVMPEEDALQLIQQVVNSVLYLHSRGLVHRDLKPANFLCAASTPAGQETNQQAATRFLKLGDFGVSAYCSDKHRLTRKVGTDGFMAPEIIRNQPYNEKADIFSIGCILHMMLTGHAPRHKECGQYITSKIRLQFMSKEMRDLIAWLMQPRPEDRPSAHEILQLPLLRRVRAKGWERSARLDAQLLDNMYAYSSFPLLKKAALVAMVSRAESDDNFSSCIAKFMSLHLSKTSGINAQDVYEALNAELVDDMADQAQRFLLELPSSPSAAPAAAVAGHTSRMSRRRRRGASSSVAYSSSSSSSHRSPGPIADGRERFKRQLSQVAEELIHKIDVSEDQQISYSEWLAATVDASWYTDTRRIKATFALFDSDGDGIISQEDLKRVIPDVFNKVGVENVLLESQHRLAHGGGSGMSEKDFVLLLQTRKPSNYTLKRIRDGLEEQLLPS